MPAQPRAARAAGGSGTASVSDIRPNARRERKTASRPPMPSSQTRVGVTKYALAGTWAVA
jgi:hypothetical protein